MSQSLTPLTALSVPPVITNSNTLVADMSALEDLARIQLKSITILGMIYSLASVGGQPNYKNNHAGAIQAGLTYMGGITNLDDVGISKQIWLILAVLSWHAGVSADATLSSDVNTLLKEARDFISLPEETLTRIYLTLFVALTI